MRLIGADQGTFLSVGPRLAHFGLGDATEVDRVVVEWPSGAVQEQLGVAVDALLTLHEPEE